ncbi:histidine kinase [Qipengyuania sp. DY56-A-20]|jgi:DNA-binding response OmpR family regulator|uniref:Histidine kinase n=1 Tax=Qipengyuania benthica TaxID=3067651 RepID=A0ABT9H5J4_9SPHN|nr:histidine kinase [Qipengyuania sp. DY56-A-20]MDP4538508.1 histidine kinase [Qipengyuania sp. DY56-A-20]
MTEQNAILLFVEDRPLLSSLQFSLAIEGFEVVDGTAGEAEAFHPSLAAALVIDQSYLEDGLAALRSLRLQGCELPAITLATNPTVSLRASAAALGAELIEKPLMGDDLSYAIRALLENRKAA